MLSGVRFEGIMVEFSKRVKVIVLEELFADNIKFEGVHD